MDDTEYVNQEEMGMNMPIKRSWIRRKDQDPKKYGWKDKAAEEK